jgi:hypothetical protein
VGVISPQRLATGLKLADAEAEILIGLRLGIGVASLFDPSERERRAREIYVSRIEVGATLTSPHREGAKNATDAAVKFAENSLKSVSLLNGGGLVAITPVMTLVGATAATDGRTILCLAGGYCIGLLASLAGHISGYQAMARRAEAFERFQSGVNSFLAFETAPTVEAQAACRAAQAKDEAAGNAKLQVYNRWVRAGLIALLVAVVAFVGASAGGAYWFWNKLAPDMNAASPVITAFPHHWLTKAAPSGTGTP